MAKHRKEVKRSRPIPLIVAGLVLSMAWSALALGHGSAAEATSATNTGVVKAIMPRETVKASQVNYRKQARSIPIPAQPIMNKAQLVVNSALTKVGFPYSWGSKGPNSFDCSGLTQWAYKQQGIAIGPDTYSQMNQGTPVSRNNIQAGDLIFPHSGHVELAISSTQAIEAPMRGVSVRIINIPQSFAAARRIT